MFSYVSCEARVPMGRRCARHSWRSLRSARVPPVDYLDKPPRSSLGATINPGDPILNVKKARSTPGAVAVEVKRARFVRFHRISRSRARIDQPQGGLIAHQRAEQLYADQMA